MTRDAVVDNSAVIERGGEPRLRLVASVALCGRWNMGGSFSRCRRTVMAKIACANGLGVVDPCYGHPCRNIVTGLADRAAGNVGRPFAGAIDPVVTFGAVARYAGVIKARRYPSRGLVTYVAFLLRGKMID